MDLFHNSLVAAKGQQCSLAQQFFITEKQVAAMMGISLSKLQKDRFYGRGIPYSKMGRSVRYALPDVQQYMESCRITPLQ